MHLSTNARTHGRTDARTYIATYWAAFAAKKLKNISSQMKKILLQMLLPSKAWNTLVPDAAEHLLHVGVRHEGLLLALNGELEPVERLVRAGAPHCHLYTRCTVLYCTLLY